MVIRMRFIQGSSREQKTFLPNCLDDYISKENPVLVIDAYFDSLDMFSLGFVKARPNATGRPMYSPQDMLKLYLYGYMNRIRSSRSLETETKRNLETIWLMKNLSPDHKTIARFRHDNPEALKNVFRAFVKFCVNLGLYGRELVAIDGSKFKAVNSKDRNFGHKKLTDRIARLEVKIHEYMAKLEQNDIDEDESIEYSETKIREIIESMATRKSIYQEMRSQLNDSEETQISLTDEDSRLMISNGKTDVCYNVQTATDSKNGLMAEFEVTNYPTDRGQGQMLCVAQSAKNVLEVDSISLSADKGYDSVPEIVQCLDNQITPHIAGPGMRIFIEAQGSLRHSDSSSPNIPCRSTYLKNRNIAI